MEIEQEGELGKGGICPEKLAACLLLGRELDAASARYVILL